MIRRTLRRAGRWLSPSALLLAGLCFALPFVSVACDTPGGFGRAAQGATTTYTGIDLVVGAEPKVSPPERARPESQARDARLWPQPAAIAVLVLLVTATALAVRVADPRVRRAGVAALSGVAATALLVNQALVETELAARVSEQLAQALPAGKSVRDYVQTGVGFTVCLLLLVAVSAANAIGWWRARPRRALVAEGPRGST